MKKSVSIKAAGGGALFALLVGGIGGFFLTPPLGNNLEVYPVKLTPETGNVLDVKVDENSKKCTSGKHAGCLLFKKDKVGTINFFVTGSKKNTKSCEKGPNDRKVITKIELTTTGAADKGVFNGEAGWVAPQPWLKKNAFPSVDLTTGIAYEADLVQARTRVFLTNMNNHDADDGEKTFWYKVWVEQCNGVGGEWKTDPRGDNKGNNY